MERFSDNRLLCPNCGSRQVGEIGPQRHYCRSCYVEFDSGGEAEHQVYLIDDDGNLLSLKEGAAQGNDNH